MTNSISHLNLVVLRSKDINNLREFYESLGLSFFEEKHGKGPTHYSSKQENVVFELYPTKDNQDNTMLGFAISDLEITIKNVGTEYVHKKIFDTDEGRAAILRDPDGRLVYLLENS